MTDFTTGGRATVRDVLVDAERRLERAGVPSPSVDASELVAFALGTTRTRLFLHDRLDPDQRVRVEQLITQRLNRVPLQHITGTAPFRRLVVSVGPGVFIPRPETELVTEAAIRALGEFPEGERLAVDLCTGSGVIALSLATEVPSSRVTAVELDDVAVGWTRANVTAHRAVIDAAGSSLDVVHGDAVTVAQDRWRPFGDGVRWWPAIRPTYLSEWCRVSRRCATMSRVSPSTGVRTEWTSCAGFS